VTWWSSAFDHVRKERKRLADDAVDAAPGYRIVALDGGGYPRNISLRRVRDHYRLGREFARRAPGKAPPDLVLCSYPPIELTAEAARYATARGIPCFIDICDTWPDAFTQALPAALRPCGGILNLPWRRQLRSALRSAAGLLAVSGAYLDWGLRKAGRPRGAGDAVFVHAYQRQALPDREREAHEARWMALGARPDRFIGCFFGTLSRLRDIGTVIETARELERRKAPAQFILGGVGDEADHFRSRAAGLSNVLFTGWVDAGAITAMLGMSRVGLIPYRDRAPQSLPNKPFEYFSAGLPVLSSLPGEMEAIVRDHQVGLTYRAGDAGDLRAKLEALMADEPGRRRMAANALGLFERAYRAETVYDDLVRHLGSALSGRRGA
jgi:glycosyltransferase involved in cell wall biosynthesis